MPHLGIITGLKSEAAILKGLDDIGFPATVVCSGAEIENARRQVRRLVVRGATHILSFGFAGGLDPALRPGTLLLPREIRFAGGGQPVDAAWHGRVARALAGLGVVTDPLLGVDQAAVTPAEKQALYTATGAAAVDMESHVAAHAASARGLPFLALRVVCDPASAALPPAATAGVEPDGSVRIGRVLGALLRQPSQLPELMRLAGAAGAAKRSLLGGCRRCAAIGFGVL